VPVRWDVMMTPTVPDAAPRNPYWDNAKAVLVTLVVVGHALQPLAASGDPVADTLYRWIYLFHMPAFAFVTGILTAELTTRRAGRLVTGLLVPYLIFQAIQTVEVSIIRGRPAPLHLLEPRWTLWFVVAVVLWRLSAPLWLTLRPPVALAGAVALCLLAGLGSGAGHVLALDDALGFLPFFVAGLLARSRLTFGRAPRPAVTWLAGAVVLGAFVVTVLSRGAFSRAALQLGFSTDAIDSTGARGTVLRLLLLVAAAATAWGVLVLVPRGAHAWTTIGRSSMYVYLLHPLVLLPFRGGEAAGWGTAVVASAAVVLAVVLATPLVRRLTRWAVEPVWARRLVAARAG
jgi:fucose 4-O-acetylase-like acetyltransferase